MACVACTDEYIHFNGIEGLMAIHNKYKYYLSVLVSVCVCVCVTYRHSETVGVAPNDDDSSRWSIEKYEVIQNPEM